MLIIAFGIPLVCVIHLPADLLPLRFLANLGLLLEVETFMKIGFRMIIGMISEITDRILTELNSSILI